jgi:hypothetical protein
VAILARFSYSSPGAINNLLGTVSSASHLVPGALVRHPTEPEWGIGQVQSAVGNRITVNFEHAGKKLINADVVQLVDAEPAAGPRRTP